MGYINSLNRDLDEYLCLKYKEDAEIRALFDSYHECEDLELFEEVVRELLYEFMEDQGMYGTLTDEGLEDYISESEGYTDYLIGDSINEVYGFYDEIDIKTVRAQLL